jgi:hypothetical protein
MSIFCVTKNKHINAVVCAGILKQLVRKDLFGMRRELESVTVYCVVL